MVNIVINEKGFAITQGLPCPCCGKHTRRQWEQPALLPGRTAHQQTDCLNPSCTAFYVTLSPSQFELRFGVKLEVMPS